MIGLISNMIKKYPKAEEKYQEGRSQRQVKELHDWVTYIE